MESQDQLVGGQEHMPSRSSATRTEQSDLPQGPVVVLGEAMHLFVAEPGVSFARADHFRTGVAGAETNVAVGLSRLGHHTRWLGRLGHDPSGEAVLRRLRAEAVDVSVVQLDESRPTGVLLRDSHAERAVTVQYHRAGSAATALDAKYVEHHWPQDAALAHVTGITAMLSESSRGAVGMLADCAARTGSVLSFDLNLRRKLGQLDKWREHTARALSSADIVFAGEDELEAVTDRPAPSVADQLLAGSASAVVIKHRDRSCTVATHQGTWNEVSRVRRVVDPVGAGDALSAGFLSAWLRGRDPHECLVTAVEAAAWVVGATLDHDGMPDRPQLLRAFDTALEADEVDR